MLPAVAEKIQLLDAVGVGGVGAYLLLKMAADTPIACA